MSKRRSVLKRPKQTRKQNGGMKWNDFITWLLSIFGISKKYKNVVSNKLSKISKNRLDKMTIQELENVVVDVTQEENQEVLKVLNTEWFDNMKHTWESNKNANYYLLSISNGSNKNDDGEILLFYLKLIDDISEDTLTYTINNQGFYLKKDDFRYGVILTETEFKKKFDNMSNLGIDIKNYFIEIINSEYISKSNQSNSNEIDPYDKNFVRT
uniref:Uncharacterized protein n=1 Tax=viral metagenome TaxID=1070528 RepID=A0A6C0HQU6_9ZZZZ